MEVYESGKPFVVVGSSCSACESFKKEVKDFGDKTKKAIEKHTPEVKRMFKSLGDYLKR